MNGHEDALPQQDALSQLEAEISLLEKKLTENRLNGHEGAYFQLEADISSLEQQLSDSISLSASTIMSAI